MSAVAVVAIWVAYLAGWTAVRQALHRVPRPRWGVVLLWCAVAVPSVLQLTVLPGALAWGQRDSAAVVSGEWWRLVTSIGLQDGGWGGTAFNLVMLAVTLLLVGEVWRWWATALVLVAGGVGANLLTVLTFGQTGAGNSMATLCLLAAAAVSMSDHRSPVLLVVAAAVLLVILGDQHGLALALGFVTGALCRGWPRARVAR